MANWRLRSRGSALATLLITVATLEALLVLCTAWFPLLRDESVEALLRARLENAARGRLERVTRYVRSVKPNGPLGNFDAVTIRSANELERLELSLPAELASSATDDIETVAQLQWCVYIPPTALNEAFPPAYSRDGGVFQQSFAASNATVVSGSSFSRGVWRIAVTARRVSDNGTGVCRVRLQRVVALER